MQVRWVYPKTPSEPSDLRARLFMPFLAGDIWLPEDLK